MRGRIRPALLAASAIGAAAIGIPVASVAAKSEAHKAQTTGSSISHVINEAWAKTHPKDPPLLAYGTDDDAFMQWLSNTSEQAADFVKDYLWSHPATGTTIDGKPRTLQHSGLQTIYAGAASAQFFGTPLNDPRHPDVYAIVQHGVVYTGGTKIAEHGGADPQDRTCRSWSTSPAPRD
jgi:hypothetical protein